MKRPYEKRENFAENLLNYVISVIIYVLRSNKG